MTRKAGHPVILALLAVACLWNAAYAQTSPSLARLTSVRAWSSGQVTRVALQLSGEVDWKRDQLADPPRLFFDLHDCVIRLEGDQSRVIQVGDPLVHRIRIALNQPTVARIVFDLRQDVDFEVSQLANPFRLMIELRAKNAEVRPAPSAVETGPAPTAAASPPAVNPAPAREVPAPPRPEPSQPRQPESSAAAPPVALAAPPKPAQSDSRGRRSLTRALGLKLTRVVLDPGHGGNDHGTTGPTGLVEKELVLDVAFRLGALIEQRLGAEVVYTRQSDTFVPLEERTAIANRHRADLFLSIHANSSPFKSVSGPEVFYLNFTTSKADLEVAARENAGHGKSIFELSELIQKIALKEKVQESGEFAASVQKSLFKSALLSSSRSRNRGVKKAPFVVLIGASMPSVLAEVGFVTNPREEGQLKRTEYRDRLAGALFDGVSAYASTLSAMKIASDASPASQAALKP